MPLPIWMLSSIFLVSPGTDEARMAMIDTLLGQEPPAACSCEVQRTNGADEDEKCLYVYQCTNGLSGEIASSCDVEDAQSAISQSMCEAND